MDSTDSYAAMYLWLVAERWRASQQPVDWLTDRERSCVLALSAILLTMQADGLTIAKPSYPIEYAMDNAEVIVGLHGASQVFDALDNPGLARHCAYLAGRAEAELRTLYSEDLGYFAWHRDLQGKAVWELSTWYPDVMAQVLVLMRIGRPEAPDRHVFELVAERFLAAEFEPDRPSEHIWYGLAAHRVGNRDWTDKIIAPLNELSADRIAELDALRCSSILEALTGGTWP
jgi:hypothetical protein